MLAIMVMGVKGGSRQQGTRLPNFALPYNHAPQATVGRRTRLERLRRRLGNALKGGYIPGGLKNAIEQDPEFWVKLTAKTAA